MQKCFNSLVLWCLRMETKEQWCNGGQTVHRVLVFASALIPGSAQRFVLGFVQMCAKIRVPTIDVAIVCSFS